MSRSGHSESLAIAICAASVLAVTLALLIVARCPAAPDSRLTPRVVVPVHSPVPRSAALPRPTAPSPAGPRVAISPSTAARQPALPATVRAYLSRVERLGPNAAPWQRRAAQALVEGRADTFTAWLTCYCPAYEGGSFYGAWNDIPLRPGHCSAWPGCPNGAVLIIEGLDEAKIVVDRGGSGAGLTGVADEGRVDLFFADSDDYLASDGLNGKYRRAWIAGRVTSREAQR